MDMDGKSTPVAPITRATFMTDKDMGMEDAYTREAPSKMDCGTKMISQKPKYSLSPDLPNKIIFSTLNY